MQRIDGTTLLAGVVGHPLAHTLSPAMHNAAFEALGLNWVYVPIDLPDEVALRRFAAVAPSMNCIGFNVTMPYKRVMLELCDEAATTAQVAGAVNTVHVVDGRLIGYCTDGRGLLEALEHDAGVTPTGADVVIIGAGGAAGAAFVAFLLGKAARITLVNRSFARAEELLARMRGHLNDVEAHALPLAEAELVVRRADIIVNATPVGMHPSDPSPIPIAWLHEGQVVYDMVYGTAQPTELVAGARAVGARAYDGLGMLVRQGALAIDIWGGPELAAPRDVMMAAALDALRHRAVSEP